MEQPQETHATITFMEQESLRPQVVCGIICGPYSIAEVNREGGSE